MQTDLDTAINDLQTFLGCETPKQWLDQALEQQSMLLLNHAYLEKCAARSALSMMFKHPDKLKLQSKMSRLAREELVHFEQVLKLLNKRGITYRGHKPSRYAGLLNNEVSSKQPQQLIDQLIAGAFIEARSCERFAKIAPLLDDELSKFYTSLLKSEARHYQDYLELAQFYSQDDISSRIDEFRRIEQLAILSEDSLFRFHSGIPAQRVAGCGHR